MTLTTEAIMPASYLQERQFRASRGGWSSHNVLLVWRLRGPLALPLVGRALTELVRRHEALRTSLDESGGTVVQRIRPSLPLSWHCVDLSRAGSRRGRWLHKLASDQLAQPFDLTRAPLMRIALARAGPRDHVLLWTLHHTIVDAWTTTILLRELTALYGRFEPLPPPPIQFADYAAWERELEDPVADEFWHRTLGLEPPARLRLPELVARAPSPQPTARPGVAEDVEPFVAASPAVGRRLAALARDRGATLSMVLLAGAAALLAPYAPGGDMTLGIVDANRDRPELESLVGCCMTLLPVRLDVSGAPTPPDLLARVRAATLAAYAHKLPIGRLPHQDAGWYDVLLNVIPAGLGAPPVAPGRPLDVRPLPPPRRHVVEARWPWTGAALGPVLAVDDRGGIAGQLFYDRHGFTPDRARAIAEAYARVLRGFATGYSAR